MRFKRFITPFELLLYGGYYEKMIAIANNKSDIVADRGVIHNVYDDLEIANFLAMSASPEYCTEYFNLIKDHMNTVVLPVFRKYNMLGRGHHHENFCAQFFTTKEGNNETSS